MNAISQKPRIEYRCAEPGDLDTLIPLKGKMDGRPAAAPEWVRRWPWQFVAHPWRRGDYGANSIVAILDGRMAGAIGFMPTHLDYQGRSVESAFGCELFVDPGAQGHGIGQALIDQVVARYPNSLWMNTPAAGARSYHKRGFSAVEPVNYRMLAVHPGHVLAARGKPALGAAAAWTGALLRPAIRMRARAFAVPRGVVFSEVSSFGAEFDRFHEKNRRPDLVTPRRDAAFLQWRYKDCPFGPYHAIAAHAGGEAVGFTVYRTKQSHNGTQGIVNELEADPATPGLAASLLGAALHGLLDAKAHLITALPTDPATLSVFRRAWFLDWKRTPHLYVAPGAAAKLGLPADGARWSMSMGDCDLDYF